MAVLDSAGREAVWAEFQRQRSTARQPIAVNKANGRAAVAAIDEWAEANAAAFNSAIPQPARGLLSAKEKAELLWKVLRERYNVTA